MLTTDKKQQTAEVKERLITKTQTLIEMNKAIKMTLVDLFVVKDNKNCLHFRCWPTTWPFINLQIAWTWMASVWQVLCFFPPLLFQKMIFTHLTSLLVYFSQTCWLSDRSEENILMKHLHFALQTHTSSSKTVTLHLTKSVVTAHWAACLHLIIELIP